MGLRTYLAGTNLHRLSPLKKSEFALKHAIAETEWTSPTYILDGVRWLAGGEVPIPDPGLALAVKASMPQAEGRT